MREQRRPKVVNPPELEEKDERLNETEKGNFLSASQSQRSWRDMAW
jgi:hypothetical protein